MRDYWSCSKFADWIRGTEYPDFASSDEWRDVKFEAKDAHPFRTWLADDGLDNLQTFVRWPIDSLYSIKYWLCNRFVTKTHALTADPKNIKPGQWQELDNRFFYCLFDELVNFVECELAWSLVAFDTNARAKYVAPFTAFGWFRSRMWRCSEAGLEYLDWASNLTYNEDMGIGPGHELYNQPTTQAINAKEVRVLYNWYTKVYPTRPDPYEVGGWNALYRDLDEYDDLNGWFNGDEKDEANKEARHDAITKSSDIETQYYDEDTEMLCRLIKIRSALWT